MKFIKQEYLSGERALFKSHDMKIEDTIFADGESPLKESQHIEIEQSIFKWKYPLWYCSDIKMSRTTLLETARSGIWYTHHIKVSNSVIEAPKTFRRSSYIQLDHVDMPYALESFWQCQNILINVVRARGDYFGMNSEKLEIYNLNLTGNYCFDGAKNIKIYNSTLISKDAFWNCEDVIVYDSTIIGEYLAWNSKNITFVNCTIESLQGLCYIENLKLINCKFINTTLAFEYSTVEAEIASHIDSIMNPLAGRIQAYSIGQVIMDKDQINPLDTKITVNKSLVSMQDMDKCVCS